MAALLKEGPVARIEAGSPWFMRCFSALVLAAACGGGSAESAPPTTATPSRPAYALAGTGQTLCYSDGAEIACPQRGQPFFGQNGNTPGPAPAYRDNGNGTVTDLVTGLTWTRALTPLVSWSEAQSGAAQLRTGGHSDWRLPTIKELYSLIDFGRGYFAPTAADSRPFIDPVYFEFFHASGERFFDVQLWSATRYVATTMVGDETVFGVNFADGRIKGYPRYRPGSGGSVPQRLYARYVRGVTGYGGNNFVDNDNGTVTDRASGLTWQTVDDGVPRDWRAALAYCASLALAGTTDWRLPDAKELHTIVDYSRAPEATGGPALSPPLRASNAELYFWTSTTVLDGPADLRATRAAYFAFGRALGWMEVPPGSGQRQLLDVHGAGAQRAEFKQGDPAQYPQGFGPQGDEVRIANAVRCVRGAS